MRRIGLERGPGRRIALSVMVQLDDLHAGDDGRAQLCAAHHQGGADGEVRGHDRRAHRPENQARIASMIGFVEARRPAHDVHTLIGAPAQVVTRRCRRQ
jgi:hypothetical protein